jgi:hypothetical protein
MPNVVRIKNVSYFFFKMIHTQSFDMTLLFAGIIPFGVGPGQLN